MVDVYNRHHVDMPFIKKNYKDALFELEIKGKIIANPALDQRRKRTFADRTVVTFPE